MATAVLEPLELPMESFPAGPPPEEMALPDVVQPLSKAVILALVTRRLGTRRKVPASYFAVEGTDENLLHISKEILDAPELEAIEKLDNAFRAYLVTRALQVSFLRPGFYPIPVKCVEEVYAKRELYLAERQRRVERFLAAYVTRKGEAEARLGDLFDPDDYPPLSAVAASFGVETQLLTIGTPGSLREIKQEIFEKEREKAAELFSQAEATWQQGMRVAFAELVGALEKRLEPGEDGKRKVLRSSTVDKLTDFLRTFPARNVANDQELAGLVRQMNDLLGNVDRDQLAKSPPLQDAIREGILEQILPKLEDLVGDAPVRKIRTE